MKTFKTAMVIIPPEAVWRPIQAIRERHDRHMRRWMPHITLLYPFQDRKEFEVIAPAFASACAGIPSFELELAKFRYFRHRNSCTLWLDLIPDMPLRGLYAKLRELVPDGGASRHDGIFTPHLSVGQVRNEDMARGLIQQLQSEWQTVSFTVECIHFICRGDPPHDVFSISKSFLLHRYNHVTQEGRAWQ